MQLTRYPHVPSRTKVETKKGLPKETLFKAAVARLTGLEPATPGVTGRYSNHLSYNRPLHLLRQMPAKRLCGIGQGVFCVKRLVVGLRDFFGGHRAHSSHGQSS